DGNRSYLGCHLSHAYETGACLYFTWAAPQVAAKGAELDAYQGYKNLITEVFMSEGGTVSHHHAIGTEHRAWMRRELGDTGIQVLGALKHSLDPRRIMNPGKLLPDDLESPR
ncbi:MAG: FAD-binding oxidoreductase, partial [Salinibacterium sp.]|nr:FAD-binding oxidoreductase [Salinibacterium sp.]